METNSLEHGTKNLEIATLGGGCFWCTEAIFKRLKGVESVISGYAGGHTENPTYDDLHVRDTGHAEVIQIKFDPTVIGFEEILEVFWKLHDPTTLNEQGNDVGKEYRSIILYHNEHQKEVAEKSKKELEASGVYKDPIVTEISPFKAFYEAEDYHQNFYDRNRDYGYCQVIIDPKIRKLYKDFEDKLKN